MITLYHYSNNHSNWMVYGCNAVFGILKCSLSLLLLQFILFVDVLVNLCLNYIPNLRLKGVVT